MRLALSRVGIEKYFRNFCTSEELNAKKPDLRFFQEILKQLRLNPYEVVMVGNDYNKDIKPAKTIGMWTILYAQIKDADCFQYADFIINEMEELNSVITKIS